MRISTLFMRHAGGVEKPAFNPVQHSLKKIAELINSIKKTAGDNPALDTAFAGFERQVRTPSPIGAYITQAFSPDNFRPGLTKREREIFCAALYFAVAPATTRISSTVAELNQHGFKWEANAIEQNLHDESGDGHHRSSHMDLLNESINIFAGNAVNSEARFSHFGPQSFPMALDLWNLRKNGKYPKDYGEFIDLLNEGQALSKFYVDYLSRANPLGFRIPYAFHYTARPLLDMLPPSVGEYGQALLAHHNKPGEKGRTHVLESVLQHLAQELDADQSGSVVRSYHNMLSNYLGYISPYHSKRAMLWSTIHIGDKTGVEDQHVIDAVQVACNVILKCRSEAIVSGLNSAAHIKSLRWQHWHDVVECMKEVRAEDLRNNIFPLPPNPPTRQGIIQRWLPAFARNDTSIPELV